MSEMEKERLHGMKAEKAATRSRNWAARLAYQRAFPRPRRPKRKRVALMVFAETHANILKAQRMASALNVASGGEGRILFREIIDAGLEWFTRKAKRELRALAKRQPSMAESVRMILEDS